MSSDNANQGDPQWQPTGPPPHDAAPTGRKGLLVALGAAVVVTLVAVVVIAVALGSDDEKATSSETTVTPASTTRSLSVETTAPDETSTTEPDGVTTLPESPTTADLFGGDGEPVTLTGSGDSLEKFTNPAGPGKPFVVRADFEGDGLKTRFAIGGRDDSGNESDAGVQLFETDFHGSALIGVLAYEKITTQLAIAAPGPWKLVISPVSKARTWDGTSTISGEGPDVIVLQHGATLPIRATYTAGDPRSLAYFTGVGRSGRLGSVGDSKPGDVLIPTGALVIELTKTGGAWTLAPHA